VAKKISVRVGNRTSVSFFLIKFYTFYFSWSHCWKPYIVLSSFIVMANKHSRIRVVETILPPDPIVIRVRISLNYCIAVKLPKELLAVLFGMPSLNTDYKQTILRDFCFSHDTRVLVFVRCLKSWNSYVTSSNQLPASCYLIFRLQE
jgi:hypothetical protein